MPICRNCRVEIDENLERCPLCLAPSGSEPQRGVQTAPSPDPGRPSTAASSLRTRLRLWEIVSLFAGAAAAVVLVADFAYGVNLTWSRYPLLAVAYLWSIGTLLIFLRRGRLLLLLGQTAASAVFLLKLDRLLPGEPWFLTLALPLTVLAGVLAGGVSAVAQALRPRLLPMLAVVLGSAGLFVLGLEAVLNLHLSGVLLLSWSLVVVGCIVPLVGLLLYVQYRLKVTHSDMRKIFHL